MSACIFCEIVRNEMWAATVYEDEEHVAFMNINPFSIGHTLVVPKKHYADMFGMEVEEISKLCSFVSKVAKAVKLAMKADGGTIIQNNGPATGQKVFHVHVHVIPSSMDKPFIMKWKKIDVSKEELLSIAAKIREKFMADTNKPERMLT